MAVPKTSVSMIQEFCSKKKISLPVYTTIADDELGFVCKIEIMDIEEMGNGRSKRDAKHLAANAAIKRLKASGEWNFELTENAPRNENDISDVQMPPIDMVMSLRDYCVQHEHPLPKFDLVNQFGTPNAPRFTMLCQLASIKRYGTSDNKKHAKQKAAFEMLNAIRERDLTITSACDLEVESVNSKAKSEEEQRYRLFKTYRELIESGESTETFGVPINERHNFFTRFYPELKNEAHTVLCTTYESEKTKAFDLLTALKIRPKIDQIPSVSGKKMTFIELDCKGLDTCFAGFENEIYDQIIDFFKIMLV